MTEECLLGCNAVYFGRSVAYQRFGVTGDEESTSCERLNYYNRRIKSAEICGVDSLSHKIFFKKPEGDGPRASPRCTEDTIVK